MTTHRLFPITPEPGFEPEAAPVELGVRFEAAVLGAVTKLHYFRSGEGGTRTGRLWSQEGVLLAEAAFEEGPEIGWQTATLSAPVVLGPGGYVVSYDARFGYSLTQGFFAEAVSSGPLTAPASGNGVFAYGEGAAFPTDTYLASNYWADFSFTPIATPSIEYRTTATGYAIEAAPGLGALAWEAEAGGALVPSSGGALEATAPSGVWLRLAAVLDDALGARHVLTSSEARVIFVRDGEAGRVAGGAATDIMIGRGDDDDLDGVEGDDTLDGGEGADRLRGGDGADRLIGGAGSDLLDGGIGADWLKGGDGNDLYVVDDARDRVVEATDGGRDTVRSSLDHRLADHVEELILVGFRARAGTGNGHDNRIVGNGHDNALAGFEGADLLVGRGGEDDLDGGAGDDLLRGGDGDDDLHGGDGDDALRGGAGDDRVDGGEGSDALRGHEGRDRLEALAGDDALFGGDGGDGLDGGAGDDLLRGGLGSDALGGGDGGDRLVGGEGHDRLTGGAGMDILTGGGGRDAFCFDRPDEGGDRIRDFEPGADTIVLRASGFEGLGPSGPLAPELLGSGRAAPATGARLAYEAATGRLFWDADAGDRDPGVLLATLSGRPVLDASDVLLV